MNFIDLFTKNEYDNRPFLRKNGRDFTLKEIKKFAAFQRENFLKSDKENVVLFGDSNFDFMINFFGAVFAKKNIFLLTDKTRLNQLDIDYILPEKFEEFHVENYEFPAVNPEEIFVTLFTSGSTFSPKKFKKSLYNILAESKDIYEQFYKDFPSEKTIVAATTNPAHMFGLTFYFILPFEYGYIIDTERVSFPEELDLKKDYILISTPAFLDRITDYRLKSYPRIIFTAGSKLKQETFEIFEKNSKVVDIYGSTETSTIAYRSNSKDEYLTLVDNVKLDTKAEVITVESEYFLEDKLTIADSYEMVGEKQFILKKRTDRIVKIMEKRVLLSEMESIVNKHEFVKENYCLKYGDNLAAVVVLNESGKEFFIKNGKLKTVQKIKNFCKNYSEILPKKWKFLPEIPTTQSGKIDRTKIENLFDLNLSFPFITSKNIGQNSLELKLIFYKNSNFFNGHFENFPIVPGVVQLFYANFFTENILGIKLPLTEAKKVKFSNIIPPDKEITLKIKEKENSVEYTYLSDDKIFSSGIFVK